MATIVQTMEEDPLLSVVRFTAELAWSDAGPEVAEPQVNRLYLEAQDCMIMERWLDLASLMLTSAELVSSQVSEKDFECIFTVICNLVTKTTSLDEALEMSKVISSKIIQQPSDKPALRLKILFNLYNLLVNPYSKFFVYMKALDLASQGKVSDNLIPSFKKIDNFLKDWKIGKLEQRELFLAISNILKDSKSFSKDSFSFLSKYLATFSVEDTSSMSEAKEEAVRAIVEFVKTPDLFQCDLLDLPAIRQLENDAKYEPVFQLLKIFLTQTLEAYLAFHSENSSVLKSYGLVHEDCVTKMRLLSLTELGSRGSVEIPYSVIRDTIQVSDDEVELWVLKAITAKLLSCKMNQKTQTISVSRCTERTFGLAQWQALRSKLGDWKVNIGNIVNKIQVDRVTEEAAAGIRV